MNLLTPIEELSNIRPQYQKRLKKLGIKTIQDLIFHFPYRYEDFSNIVPVSEIKIEAINSIQGKILKIKNRRTWKKRMILTEAIIQDKSGLIKVIWFNQPYLTKTLKPGDFVSLAGKITLKQNKVYLSNPSYEKITQAKQLTHTGRIVPIYPETEKLSSKWLRFIIKPILKKIKNEISDPLPEKIIKTHNLLNFQKAIWQIHFPDSLTLAERAKQRFQFEELFLIMLLVLKKRQKISQEKAMIIPLNLEIIKSFINTLPFKLTDSQKKSAWQILKDLEKIKPMNRLLEGDVGSGKTVVATITILNIIKAGYQVALMAPTEILAKQHFKTIQGMLKDFNIKIGLLTGKESKFQNRKILRKKLLAKIKNKEVDLLIGTHALIQPSDEPDKEIKFKNLALVILDEQHRFGVAQRAKLIQDQKFIPHFLSMTATPIPRTLSLTIYGDLDLSLITEMPKGRKKIITKIISPQKRQEAYDFIREQVREGRQVFVICPRIEPTNNLQQTTNNKQLMSWAEVKAVKDEYKKLSKQIFPDLKIEILHGKMSPEEKEKIMKRMKKQKIDILVSTSVIEVGIDIPNATVMLIEGAERFGLAQLHQFRGRVGRAEHQSFCLLFTDSPAIHTNQRLKALITSENGFELAEKDLQIRGPGDFIGNRQSGIPDLIMNSLKDISLVEKTKEAVREILTEDPGLKKYPLLEKKVQEFEKKIHME
jgi:ATP-dependent DNA helicase RecG